MIREMECGLSSRQCLYFVAQRRDDYEKTAHHNAAPLPPVPALVPCSCSRWDGNQWNGREHGNPLEVNIENRRWNEREQWLWIHSPLPRRERPSIWV